MGKGHPEYYQDAAAALAADIPGAWFADQFNNAANPLAHETSTGPEIWAQTGHDVDAIVVGVGSSGTITGAAALVSVNFSTAAEAIAFFDAVCGPTLRFSGSNELLTFDTPRKRSVLVTTKPTPLSIPDRTDAFRAFAPTLIGAFGGETSAFAVSELVCGDGASSAFLLVDNSPVILHTASEHSSFVHNLVASLGDAASAYVLTSPTEALGAYASVPVCLNSFSGYRKMFNLLVSTGQNGVRKLLTICKDPAGHLLTAGPRPSTGPELTISTA